MSRLSRRLVGLCVATALGAMSLVAMLPTAPAHAADTTAPTVTIEALQPSAFDPVPNHQCPAGSQIAGPGFVDYSGSRDSCTGTPVGHDAACPQYTASGPTRLVMSGPLGLHAEAFDLDSGVDTIDHVQFFYDYVIPNRTPTEHAFSGLVRSRPYFVQLNLDFPDGTVVTVHAEAENEAHLTATSANLTFEVVGKPVPTPTPTPTSSISPTPTPSSSSSPSPSASASTGDTTATDTLPAVVLAIPPNNKDGKSALPVRLIPQFDGERRQHERACIDVETEGEASLPEDTIAAVYYFGKDTDSSDDPVEFAHSFSAPFDLQWKADNPFLKPEIGHTYELTAHVYGPHGFDPASSNTLTVTIVSGSGAGSNVDDKAAELVNRWRQSNVSAAFGGSFISEHLAGASASYTFQGTQITWLTTQGPAFGKANVAIDGTTVAIVNNGASRTGFAVPVWTSANLARGTHTVKITVRGEPAFGGSDSNIAVDGFRVRDGEFQTDVPTPNMKQTWRRVSNFNTIGGTFIESDSPNAAVQLDFRGSTIDWYTITSYTMGQANVVIDGAVIGTVDNYAPTTTFRVLRHFTMAFGSHRLQIMPTGRKNAAARSALIAVDQIQVK